MVDSKSAVYVTKNKLFPPLPLNISSEADSYAALHLIAEGVSATV